MKHRFSSRRDDVSSFHSNLHSHLKNGLTCQWLLSSIATG